MNEKDFDELFEKAYEEKRPNPEASINIALVGKVSSGKSSFLNAFFERSRHDPLAAVGAHSGVTTRVTHYKLDDHVFIIDCPGLDDVREENSKETEDFLKEIDIGLLIVTGSADSSQKSSYDDLKRHCKHVIVVLNKIDEWDDLEEDAYNLVVEQWKTVLGANKIFGACTKGYDPKMRQTAPMDLRGIEEIRSEVLDFLEKEGKAILIAKHLANKEKFAIGIITGSLLAVAGEAFIPGSAAYITATQIAAITSLHYLYTGTVLSKSSALALWPPFAARAVGGTLFIGAKSFFPPTGIADVAAAGIAMAITFAMLASVKKVLEDGYSLERQDLLMEAFDAYKTIGEELKKISFSDFKNEGGIITIVKRLLSTGKKLHQEESDKFSQ